MTVYLPFQLIELKLVSFRSLQTVGAEVVHSTISRDNMERITQVATVPYSHTQMITTLETNHSHSIKLQDGVAGWNMPFGGRRNGECPGI